MEQPDQPLEIVDTHCHIQSIVGEGTEHTHQKWQKAGLDGPAGVERVVASARVAGVTQLICVGCDLPDSELAVGFVQGHDSMWASIGIHPHEAKTYHNAQSQLQRFTALARSPKVVAVGECGLDYFYEHSPREQQQALLRYQMELAQTAGLPMIFHVRDAFDDFWPIFDEYSTATQPVRGVIHSFTANTKVLDQALARGLYVGLNGILTFSKDQTQLEAAKAVPLERMLIETDAPYLTPNPYRGKICESKHARTNLEFVAHLQGESVQRVAATTTANARRLFNLAG